MLGNKAGRLLENAQRGQREDHAQGGSREGRLETKAGLEHSTVGLGSVKTI